MMRPDSIAREPEIFGNEFVDHFGGTRLHEVKVWNEAITSWEGQFTWSGPWLLEIHTFVAVERYLELA